MDKLDALRTFVLGLFTVLKPAFLLGFVALMLLLRWRRAGMLTLALAWWIGLYVVLAYGFNTPVPGSVVQLYMGIVTLSILAYVTSDRQRLQATVGPIVRLVVEPRFRLLLAALVVLLPALAAFSVWRDLNVPVQAPSFGRTVHPAPPDEITVHDNKISLITANNPYRKLEQSDPEAFRQHVDNGRRVYFQNCFYCHGDGMAGDGMFAHGLNPIPTRFTDPGVLPQLQESFLFWRISKGGPGMPEEGGPWDSAMPAWELHLTEEEMWDVVLFLYDFSGFRPRALHEAH